MASAQTISPDGEDEEADVENKDEEEDGLEAFYSQTKDPYASLPRNEVLSYARNLVVNHRLDEARNLLKNLLLEKRVPPIFMFKLSMLMFDVNQTEDFLPFYNKYLLPSITKLRALDVDRRDLYLELISLLVQNDEFELARELFKDQRKVLKINNRSRARIVSVDALWKCYSSYLDYWNWNKTKQYIDTSIITDIGYDGALMSEKDTCLDFMANCVVKKFKYYNDIEGCLRFYSRYARKHSNNLSAQLRLFHLLELEFVSIQNDSERELRQDLLEENQSGRLECYRRIIKLDPGNPVISSISSMVPETSEELLFSLSDSVKDLMAFLDYGTNRSSLNSWNTLIEHMKNLLIYNREEFNEVKQHYIENYHGHWQFYHFNINDLEKGLERPKVLFCTIVNINDEFVDQVIQFLDNGRGLILKEEVDSLTELRES